MNYDELRRLAEAAPPGPHKIIERNDDDGDTDFFVIFGSDEKTNDYRTDSTMMDRETASFIAACDRDTILALLDERDWFQQSLDWWDTFRSSDSSKDRESRVHGCVGCKAEKKSDGSYLWTIDPECPYHKAAAASPQDHSIPWNCPTYHDGCNCKEALRSWRAENARLRAALKEARPFVTPSVDLLLRRFNDIDGTDEKTRRIIEEIHEVAKRIDQVLSQTAADAARKAE